VQNLSLNLFNANSNQNPNKYSCGTLQADSKMYMQVQGAKNNQDLLSTGYQDL